MFNVIFPSYLRSQHLFSFGFVSLCESSTILRNSKPLRHLKHWHVFTSFHSYRSLVQYHFYTGLCFVIGQSIKLRSASDIVEPGKINHLWEIFSGKNQARKNPEPASPRKWPAYQCLL